MCDKNLVCIVCPNGCNLNIKKVENEFIVQGNLCKRGYEFAINEMVNPKRSICSTVKTISHETPRISVRTDGEIPFNDILNLMKILSTIVIDKSVNVGDIVIENILDTGINVIATSELTFK